MVRRLLQHCAAVTILTATLCFTAQVTPAAAAEVELERMTWIEVRDRIASGSTTVIVPTGGTEQNGAHMALGKHNFIVAEASRRIARVLGDALVAPVIAYVPEGSIELRTGHMAYAGTISVPDAVYSGLLEAAASSFKAHGFKLIVLLGDSGGNQAPQRDVATKLSTKWAADGVRVINAEGYYAANGGDEWLKAQGETAKAIGTHAGIRDTSELMAVTPEAVDLTRSRPDADGASGDARRATRERGEKLVAMKVDAAVNEIRAVRQGRAATAPAPGLFGRLFQ